MAAPTERSPVKSPGVVKAPPVFALVQRLVALRSRAIASAILLFIANLIGLGLGPLLLGVSSNLLTDRFGDDALRYSLLIATSIGVWASLHFFLAARTLARDLKSANSQI